MGWPLGPIEDEPGALCMLILGIETATERVSVSVGGHEGVIGLFEVTKGRRHAETLVPAIDFVCKRAGIELSEISVVAVDVGPGLFTGMRVGLSAAKAIAQALSVPMIGLSFAMMQTVRRPLRSSCRRRFICSGYTNLPHRCSKMKTSRTGACSTSTVPCSSLSYLLPNAGERLLQTRTWTAKYRSCNASRTLV